MIELPRLPDFLDAFQRTSVQVSADRCLNKRHKFNNCTLCLACPTQAITASGASVGVQADACVGCGLCSSVCPTGAFTVDGPRTSDLLRLLADERGQVVEAACPRRSPLDETRTGASTTVRLPCLAWLSPSVFAGLVAQGLSALWLDDTRCAECPLAANQAAILAAADSANRMLALMGHAPAVHCYSASTQRLQRPRKSQVADPRQPTYSRRGFFGALRRMAADSASAVAEQNLPATPQAKLAAHLPAQRSLLGAALPRLGQPPAGPSDTSGLPLARVTVGPECAACGLCAKLCPSGALAFRSDDSGFVLECTHLSCLGEACHLCRLICPVQAVALSFQVDLAEMLQGQPQVLRAGQLAPCSRCGVPAAVTDGAVLCHACRRPEGRAALPSFA